jgi:hypothetical protein
LNNKHLHKRHPGAPPLEFENSVAVVEQV